MYEGRWRVLGWFILGKTRVKGDLTALCSCLVGKDKARVFLQIYGDRKKQQAKFGTWESLIKKTKSTLRVVKYWSKLPREVVGLPILEVFKTRPDKSLNDPCFEQKVESGDLHRSLLP